MNYAQGTHATCSLGFRKLALTFVNSPGGFHRQRWRLLRQRTLNIAAFERGTCPLAQVNRDLRRWRSTNFNIDAEADRDLFERQLAPWIGRFLWKAQHGYFRAPCPPSTSAGRFVAPRESVRNIASGSAQAT